MSDLAYFEYALFLTFIALAAGLLAATFVQVRFGLRPLSRISRVLAEMRAGRAMKLPPNLPDEIVPLAHEIDALVDANRQVVERERNENGWA